MLASNEAVMKELRRGTSRLYWFGAAVFVVFVLYLALQFWLAS
jgi:hypothetical protein